MIHKEIRIVKEDIDRRLLPFVRQPGRYIGGEINQVKKDLAACDVRIGLCFPDIYEIGMSYGGLAVLYEILNGLDGIAAERVFAPWADAEEIMRKEGLGLFTMESCANAGDLDILGFSLTNEMCYANLLNMLDLAGMEVRSENRAESDPLVIVGGNPLMPPSRSRRLWICLCWARAKRRRWKSSNCTAKRKKTYFRLEPGTHAPGLGRSAGCLGW